MPERARRLVLLLSVLVIAAATGPARADTHEVESRIEAVTVQLDRARIERRARVTLAQGQQALVFPDLPVAADRASVRLEAAADGIAIGRPSFREVETVAPVGRAAQALVEALERLERQRRIERDAIAVQELLLDVLRQSQIVVEPQAQAPLADPSNLFGMIETRGKEALHAIRMAQQAVDRLDAEIDRHRRQLTRLGEDPMRQLELTVPVTAAAAGAVDFTLTYTVHGAGFSPALDAELDVETGRVTLTAFAELSQSTGEDWEDVRLALSTAAPSWSTAAPPTDTWFIDIRPDEPQPSPLSDAMPAAREGLAMRADIVVDRSAFDVTYRIDAPQTIAADGTSGRVTIESLELPAELVWRTVPAFDPAVYLTAALTYTGSAPLLPGPVYLHRDGQAVGEAHVPGLQPGEPFELGFGADPAVAVERRLQTDERARSGLIGTARRHERRYAIEATNRRPGPVELEIVDRLPVPRDTRITVELLPESSPASTTEHDRDAGVLAWRRRLEPGEMTTVTFAYAVRHPADLELSGF